MTAVHRRRAELSRPARAGGSPGCRRRAAHGAALRTASSDGSAPACSGASRSSDPLRRTGRAVESARWPASALRADPTTGWWHAAARGRGRGEGRGVRWLVAARSCRGSVVVRVSGRGSMVVMVVSVGVARPGSVLRRRMVAAVRGRGRMIRSARMVRVRGAVSVPMSRGGRRVPVGAVLVTFFWV